MSMKTQSGRAEKRLRTDAENVDEQDAQRVLHKADRIEKKFSGAGPLGRFVSDGKLMLAMVRDYVRGSYREIPWWSVAAVTAALLYVLNPLDLVPDFVPGFGYIDDAAVIAACLRLVEKDLRKYREWKEKEA